jgi:tryptophan-rich sensory protein
MSTQALRTRPSTPQQVLSLGVIGIIVFGAAAFGNLLGGSMNTAWYRSLPRPDYAPPAWVFGPVWTLLYALMAVAAWLVWRERRRAKVALPLTIFAMQLVLNMFWSGIFFRLQAVGWAFVELVAIWIFIAATLVTFWRVSRPAAVLLLPYIAWVTFAGVLNFAIWRAL